VGIFTEPVTDVANVGGMAVGLLLGDAAVEVLDPATGSTTALPPFPTPARRIAGAPGGRIVVARDVTTAPPYGDRGNLWLYQLP
jgi:hypothetical protein